MLDVITTEAVEEAVVAMRNYTLTNFGATNGPDFPMVARALAGSSEVAMKILVEMAMSQLAGGQLAQELKNVNKDEGTWKKLLAQKISVSPVFQGYAEAVYLGYVLGRKAAEVEHLENLQNK